MIRFALTVASVAIAVLGLRRLLIDRLWADIAMKGLVRYLQDAREHIPDDALVLDVGAGDKPHIRADVLCDKYEMSWERGSELLVDRPLVMGDIDALPFKDNAFDFVISQHVLEHVADPSVALAELQRVGKAGLVRTPSPLAEKLMSRDVHRWLVRADDRGLHFKQKQDVYCDKEVTFAMASDRNFWRMFGLRVRDMETSYFWKDEIRHEVEWAPNPVWSGDPIFHPPGFYGRGDGLRPRLRRYGTRAFGKLYRGALLRRPQTVSWQTLLACPVCKSDVVVGSECVNCSNCGREYPVRSGVPIMLAEAAAQTPTQQTD
jgi:uncharacterized protein YbaR (Trm112 family)/SAM-dependent methyltransferase